MSLIYDEHETWGDALAKDHENEMTSVLNDYLRNNE